MSRKTREQAAARAETSRKANARRNFILGGAAAGMAALAAYGFMAALSAPPIASKTVEWNVGKAFETDVSIGSADAPVTVYEYASLTCVHCARFHNESLPGFIDGWVKTGKARLVYRHFPVDAAALDGAVAVSCMPPDLRADAVGTAMRNRDGWAHSDKPGAALAGLVGMSRRDSSRTSRCVAGGGMRDKLAESILQARRGGISGTPSFVVGHKLYTGFMSAEALGAIVDAEF